MTAAKAKALASDLVDAGCEVRLDKNPLSGEWIVDASRTSNPVSPTQIAALATTHGVTAVTDRARFT